MLGKAIDFVMNEQAADNALDRELSSWSYQFNTTNAYNSPEAQRKRLEDAGFNAAAIMSNGSPQDVTGSSRSAPSASPHPFNATSPYAQNIAAVANAEKAIADAELARKNAGLTEYEAMRKAADTAYKNSMSILYESQAIHTNTLNEISKVDLAIARATEGNQIFMSDMAANQAVMNYTSAYYGVEQQLFDLYHRSPAEVQHLYTTMQYQFTEITLNRVRTELAKKNIHLTDAEIDKVRAEIGKIQAETATEGARKASIEKDTEIKDAKFQAEKGHYGYRAVIQSIDNTLDIHNDFVNTGANLLNSVAGAVSAFRSLNPKHISEVSTRVVDRYDSKGKFVGSTNESVERHLDETR